MRHQWYFRKWVEINDEASLAGLDYRSNRMVAPGDKELARRYGLAENENTHQGVMPWLVKRFCWKRIAILELEGENGIEFRLCFEAACGASKAMPFSIVHQAGRKVAMRVGPDDLRISLVGNGRLVIKSCQLTNLGSKTAEALENADVVIY